jgi:uncharacterized protein YciI
MFIVSLQYTQPLEVVESQLQAHRAFLDRFYQQGVFIASGRKVPRNGGVILAKGVTRAELEKILDQDPFRALGVADYQITEFTANRTSADFAGLLEL